MFIRWALEKTPAVVFFLFLLELFEMLRIDKMPLITKHVQTNLARCRHLAPISEIVAGFFLNTSVEKLHHIHVLDVGKTDVCYYS